MLNQAERIAIGAGIVLANTLGVVIYVRAALPIMAMVPDSGPFTQPVQAMYTVVPVAFGAIYLVTAYWVISSGGQEEKAVAQQRVVQQRRQR